MLLKRQVHVQSSKRCMDIWSKQTGGCQNIESLFNGTPMLLLCRAFRMRATKAVAIVVKGTCRLPPLSQKRRAADSMLSIMRGFQAVNCGW
jgi:hypothetical protein